MSFWKKKEEYVVEKLTKDFAGTRLDVNDYIALWTHEGICFGIVSELIDTQTITIKYLNKEKSWVVGHLQSSRILKLVPLQLPINIKIKLDGAKE